MGRKSDEERFWAKVHKDPRTGCWLWTAATTQKGYGEFRYKGKVRRAHRVAFMWANGWLPAAPFQLDHLCHNRACVNPGHLEPVTHRENQERSDLTKVALARARSHCPHGHPFDEANTIIRRDGRGCRICAREAGRRSYHKHRAAGT
jgi:hypothetical protein